jgi:hypothetical protein
MGKLPGKQSLGKARRKWTGNVKIYLKVIGFEDVNWFRSGL